MSTTTENLNLTKLELSDTADITLLNENWDKLDNEINNLNDTDNNLKECIDELKDTIGYSKKNLLKNINITSAQTKNGVTCTPNADGSFTLTGTNTAQNTFFNINYVDYNARFLDNGDYIVSGESNNVEIHVYKQNGLVGYTGQNNGRFTITDDVLNCWARIQVVGGATNINETVYPMIRYASIEDDTYEPYVEDVGTRINNVQGAIDEISRYTGLVKSKNLLINIFETKSYNGGGTVTVNKDKSITINGTFTDSGSTVFLDNKNNNLELGKQYVASISKVDVGITFHITFYTSGTTTVDCASTNTSINFTTPNAVYLNRFLLNIPRGTYDNVTVYPMISTEVGEYEPYVEDVQTQIDNGFGEIKYWTPLVPTFIADRCYYVKTKNTLKVWFSVTSNQEITITSPLALCNNIKSTFGINSWLQAWNKGLAIRNGSDFHDGVIAIKNNEIYFEYAGTNIPTNSNLYGFVEFGRLG